MTRLPDTRRSLLIRLGERCPAAWNEFAAVYERAIYAFCRRRGLQDADARDAVQKTLMAVHDRIPSWDHDRPVGGFRSWLFRVAQNIAVDEVRRRQRAAARLEAHMRGHPEAATVANEDNDAFEREYRRAMFAWASDEVRACVREQSWACFWLTSVNGIPAEVAAARLGVSVGALHTAKCRVMTRLREAIARAEPDDRNAQPGAARSVDAQREDVQ